VVRTKPGEKKEPVSVPEVKYRPKRVIKKSLKNFGTPSVKSALQGKKADKVEEISAADQFQMHRKNEQSEPFTKEDMEKKWNTFLRRLDDRPNLKSTLSRLPELRDNWQLYLEIDNSIQNDIIISIKPELLTFLRKELKNTNIELVTKVTENIKNPIIYTDEDKFEEMAKKNASLRLLKQKFNLDFGEI
jgi:hypothetical protein